MVIPGVALIGGELMMRTGAVHFDKAVGCSGVCAVHEQLHRVAATHFIGGRITLKFTFDAGGLLSVVP